MKIYEETTLAGFDFWAGAKDRANLLTFREMEVIEIELNELYPDGLSRTELNDLFWFEFDAIAAMIGYANEDEFFDERL